MVIIKITMGEWKMNSKLTNNKEILELKLENIHLEEEIQKLKLTIAELIDKNNDLDMRYGNLRKSIEYYKNKCEFLKCQIKRIKEQAEGLGCIKIDYGDAEVHADLVKGFMTDQDKCIRELRELNFKLTGDNEGLRDKVKFTATQNIMLSEKLKQAEDSAAYKLLNKSTRMVKTMLQEVLDQGYPVEPEGGLAELKRFINLAITQDKKQNWHGGVPKDALIAQYEHELGQLKKQLIELKRKLKKASYDLLKTLDEDMAMTQSLREEHPEYIESLNKYTEAENAKNSSKSNN